MKVRYIIYSILDFLLTFGGPATVIVISYITETNPLGFKLTITGIMLVLALIFTAKSIFEKKYRSTYDTLLQQLAEANDKDLKDALSKKIEAHKTKNRIYERLMIVLPFAILYVLTWLGAEELTSLHDAVGLIMITLTGGSIFNVAKNPLEEQLSLDKIIKKKAK